MHISILFPSSWDRKRILRATRRLGEAFHPQAITLDVHTGATDGPCVDCTPPGGESAVSRILEGVQP